MYSHTSNDIKVSVSCHYNAERSYPLRNHYVFEYHVSIFNEGNIAVQLLNRHWFIFDSGGFFREVQGDGVIGKQPILEPGESHHYKSWCTLKTPIGTMDGKYGFVDLSTLQPFDATIPPFKLVAPFKLN